MLAGRGGPAGDLPLPGVALVQAALDYPLERVNREIGRRSDVVGDLAQRRRATRLAGALLIEQNDEWLVSRRYLSEESLALVLRGQPQADGREEVVAKL